MAGIVTPERREQARQYRRIKYRLTLINFAIAGLYLVLLVAGGSRWLGALVANPVLFLLALLLGMAIAGLPVDYYGHLQARRFGLSVQSAGSWLADEAKGFLISSVLNGGLGWMILSLWAARPGTWYIWTALVAVAGQLLLAFVWPVLIAPLFHKYRPLPDGELKDRLMALSQKVDVYVRGVFISDVSKKATTLNASLSGLGSTRRITLQDTTIAACTPEEIEVVMAHEMGHHVHGHIFKLTGLMSLFVVIVFLVAGFAVQPLSHLLGLGGLTKEALPLLLVLFAVLGLIALPVLMAISRQFERDCDSFAFRVTGKPEAFISFFHKVADRNLSDLEPPRWVYYFQYSHPPVLERIAAAQQFAGGRASG